LSPDDHRRRRIATFLTLAFEEMKDAEMLLDTLPRQSAFFQQQAAEKCLRAVEVEGVPAGPTHNLRTLADLLPADHVMKPEFLAVEEWSSAATRFRYPSGSGAAPTVSKAILSDRQGRLAALQQVVSTFISSRNPLQ
jgi:HEPN domain-containing protein